MGCVDEKPINITMPYLMDKVRDEPSAYLFLEKMRWQGRPFCPHCHGENVVYLNPLNGHSRLTRTGNTSQRRVWKCRDCVKQFSVLTGTIFHGSKIAVRTWIFVVFEMCTSKNGVAAREIERKYGITNKTAWHMLHRIREAMKNGGVDEMLGGPGHVIVADETFIGGSLKRMNAGTRRKAEAVQKVIPHGAKLGGPSWNKVAVLSLIDTTTGQVRSKVVADVTGATLRKAVAEQVHMESSILHTDEAKAYRAIGREFAAHETVNHAEDIYVRKLAGKIVTSNQAENFFSQLKRSLDGTHHHVSKKHLFRYLAEFDYRYSTRDESDTSRFVRLLGMVAGVRLSYRPLAAG
ncbi:MAG: putative transposase for insertion sequence element [Acidimicrobiales bacterium]|nr:putative transposase for insertion sequence element [Acidimicrobiales bacterium]